jgi:hypothetical protein
MPSKYTKEDEKRLKKEARDSRIKQLEKELEDEDARTVKRSVKRTG